MVTKTIKVLGLALVFCSMLSIQAEDGIIAKLKKGTRAVGEKVEKLQKNYPKRFYTGMTLSGLALLHYSNTIIGKVISKDFSSVTEEAAKKLSKADSVRCFIYNHYDLTYKAVVALGGWTAIQGGLNLVRSLR